MTARYIIGAIVMGIGLYVLIFTSVFGAFFGGLIALYILFYIGTAIITGSGKLTVYEGNGEGGCGGFLFNGIMQILFLPVSCIVTIGVYLKKIDGSKKKKSSSSSASPAINAFSNKLRVACNSFSCTKNSKYIRNGVVTVRPSVTKYVVTFNVTIKFDTGNVSTYSDEQGFKTELEGWSREIDRKIETLAGRAISIAEDLDYPELWTSWSFDTKTTIYADGEKVG